MRGLVAIAVLFAVPFASLPAAAQEDGAGDNRPESRLLMRLLDKVERLQAELREVRDRGDRQARELRRLRKKMREIEGRRAATTATAAIAATAVSAVSAVTTASAAAPMSTASTANAMQPPAAEQEAPDDDARAAATPAPAETERAQVPPSGDGEPPRDAAQTARTGDDRAPPPVPRLGFLPKDEATPGVKDERQAYRRATRALNDDDYARLRRDLEAFLRDWPRGRYAANAKFWIGEAWYAERNLDKAEAYYQRVVEENADHDKSEDAYLKLAYIHIDREQWDAAAAVLQNLAEAAAQDRIRALARKKLGQVKKQER